MIDSLALWKTVWRILISWLLSKPADLVLHCFQKKTYLGSAEGYEVYVPGANYIVPKKKLAFSSGGSIKFIVLSSGVTLTKIKLV